jgi:hypothetical protein
MTNQYGPKIVCACDKQNSKTDGKLSGDEGAARPLIWVDNSGSDRRKEDRHSNGHWDIEIRKQEVLDYLQQYPPQEYFLNESTEQPCDQYSQEPIKPRSLQDRKCIQVGRILKVPCGNSIRRGCIGDHDSKAHPCTDQDQHPRIGETNSHRVEAINNPRRIHGFFLPNAPRFNRLADCARIVSACFRQNRSTYHPNRQVWRPRLYAAK